jgi:hypothetical protein
MIREALNAFVIPRIWDHDRRKTIGSSEIGQCARRIKYLKTESPHDHSHTPRWGATERGNLFEKFLWEPALRKRYGNKLRFAGEQQKTFIDKHLSATPDGLLIEQPRSVLKYLGVKDIGIGACLMVECKTIDPRVNLAEAKHVNTMQTQVQMGLVREQTIYKPKFALLSYANASFMDDITEFAIEFDQKIYDHAKVRARTILEAKAPKDLKPEGWIAGGKECDHCPFAEACGIAQHNLPSAKYNKEADPQFKAEMIDMVRAAKKVKAVMDAATVEFRTHQETIRERLREKGLYKIPGVVNWISVKGRISYDDEAIRKFAVKNGMDIEKYSDVGEATSRLMLGDVGESE